MFGCPGFQGFGDLGLKAFLELGFGSLYHSGLRRRFSKV